MFDCLESHLRVLVTFDRSRIFPSALFLSIDGICRNLLTIERIEQHEDTSGLKANACVNFRFYLERQRERENDHLSSG